MPDMKINRDADAVIVDDPTGTWYAAWNVHEGFDPFTAAIRATGRSAAEEVWFEQFPDRGEPETLHITECTLSVNVTIAWPDGEVTPAEPRYIAHFNPEVWVRDTHVQERLEHPRPALHAVDADPEGEQEWDCTEGLAAMHPDYRAELLAEMTADEDGSVIDRHDALKSDPNAPDWVRAWHGPFTIRVRLADPTT